MRLLLGRWGTPLQRSSTAAAIIHCCHQPTPRASRRCYHMRWALVRRCVRDAPSSSPLGVLSLSTRQRPPQPQSSIAAANRRQGLLVAASACGGPSSIAAFTPCVAMRRCPLRRELGCQLPIYILLRCLRKTRKVASNSNQPRARSPLFQRLPFARARLAPHGAEPLMWRWLLK